MSKPIKLPLSITLFALSGKNDTVVKSTPKNVPKKYPTMVVPIPNTTIIGPNPLNISMFIFLKCTPNPKRISAMPYPASPIHIAKNSKKNGANIGVGSNSL